MTDTGRGGKPQGWRARVAEGIVKVSWWHGQPALYYGTVLISFVMFHAHRPIGKIVNSEEICSSELFLEKMSLVIPKLQQDCDLIATTLFPILIRKSPLFSIYGYFWFLFLPFLWVYFMQ